MPTVAPDQRQSVTLRDSIIDHLSLGDVLQRLSLLAPDDLRAIEVLAKYRLRRNWPGADEDIPIDQGA